MSRRDLLAWLAALAASLPLPALSCEDEDDCAPGEEECQEREGRRDSRRERSDYWWRRAEQERRRGGR